MVKMRLTDVEGGAVGPGFGDGVEGVAVLQALLSTRVGPSHHKQLVVESADAWKAAHSLAEHWGSPVPLVYFTPRFVCTTPGLLTCVTAVGPKLRHLGPLVGQRIVSLPAAQLVRLSVGASHDIQLTLRMGAKFQRVVTRVLTRRQKKGPLGSTWTYHQHRHLEARPGSPHGSDESPAVPLWIVALHSP